MSKKFWKLKFLEWISNAEGKSITRILVKQVTAELVLLLQTKIILFNFSIFITIWNKEALTAKSNITDFQHEFLFYLELEFLALDTLLYFSENRWSSVYNSNNTVTSARLLLIAFIKDLIFKRTAVKIERSHRIILLLRAVPLTFVNIEYLCKISLEYEMEISRRTSPKYGSFFLNWILSASLLHWCDRCVEYKT